jgi:hypothetical protein
MIKFNGSKPVELSFAQQFFNLLQLRGLQFQGYSRKTFLSVFQHLQSLSTKLENSKQAFAEFYDITNLSPTEASFESIVRFVCEKLRVAESNEKEVLVTKQIFNEAVTILSSKPKETA